MNKAILELYDVNGEYIKSWNEHKDLKLDRSIGMDVKSMTFTVNDRTEFTPEMMVKYDSEYKVKSVTLNSSGKTTVTLEENLDELKNRYFSTFSSVDKTIAEALELILANTGYTATASEKYTEGEKKRSFGDTLKNSYQLLEDVAIVYDVEFTIDSIKKAITYYQKNQKFNGNGEDKDVHLSDFLNLKKVTKKSDTNDFCTRLYPRGADGLTIAAVNPTGEQYIDNNQYSSKVVTAIWEDTDYTDAQALYDDALIKLRDMSKPNISYTVDVADIGNKISCGDWITLTSPKLGMFEVLRVVKTTLYPDQANKGSVTLSNGIRTFADALSQLKSAKQLSDNVVNSDGTISVRKILGLDGAVAETPITIGTLKTTYGDLLSEVMTEDGGMVKLDEARLVVGSLLAKKILAQDITATGTLRGATIEGGKGSFSGDVTIEKTIGNNDYRIDLGASGFTLGRKTELGAYNPLFQIDLDGHILLCPGGRIDGDWYVTGDIYEEHNHVFEKLNPMIKPTVDTVSHTVSLPNDTDVVGATSIKLPSAGTYLITVTVQFGGTSGTGYRQVAFSNDPKPATAFARNFQSRTAGINGTNVYLTHTAIVTPTAPIEYFIHFRQTSGGTIGTNYYNIRYVKLN